MDQPASRLADLEAYVLEMRVLMNALLLAVPNKDEFFRELLRDIDAWSEHKTFAAQSDTAKRVRERLRTRVQALLARSDDETNPKSSRDE